MAKRRANITKADVERQAQSMGLTVDLADEHDWSHLAVFLDLYHDGLIPEACIINRTLTDSTARVKNDSRRQYYKSVRTTAEEVVENLADAEDDDRIAAINEAVSQSYWVIYPHASLACLVFSDNWLAIDEAMDESGTEAVLGESASLTGILTQAAFWAFSADVSKEVERIMEERGLEDDEADDEDE